MFFSFSLGFSRQIWVELIRMQLKVKKKIFYDPFFRSIFSSKGADFPENRDLAAPEDAFFFRRFFFVFRFFAARVCVLRILCRKNLKIRRYRGEQGETKSAFSENSIFGEFFLKA